MEECYQIAQRTTYGVTHVAAIDGHSRHIVET